MENGGIMFENPWEIRDINGMHFRKKAHSYMKFRVNWIA